MTITDVTTQPTDAERFYHRAAASAWPRRTPPEGNHRGLITTSLSSTGT